ncbi:MAG: universal stress protein [Planctomycetaceae bacterium]
MIELQRILVATDFSEHSDNAVRYAAEFAKVFGSELHLLHVAERVPIMYGEGGAVTPEIESEAITRAQGMLNDLLADSVNLKVERSVVPGHPFVEICRYAKDHDIDLIVIGTHGRGAFAHLLMGSVAERVVRKAKCPVMTVREGEHEFVMP